MISDIWSFQRQLVHRLTIWALISLLLGLAMLFLQARFWLGMGLQFIAWGAVNGVIAWLGGRSARQRHASLEADQMQSAQIAEKRKIGRILWINTALDVLYVLGGGYLARTLGANNPFWYGTGIGVIIQGGFLFFFDWLHAKKLS
jgi:hypothetical protein